MDTEISRVQRWQVATHVEITRVMVTSFIVVDVTVIMITSFLIFKTVFINFRVLEGRNSQVDIVTGDDSTADEATEDSTVRGGEVYPKG